MLRHHWDIVLAMVFLVRCGGPFSWGLPMAHAAETPTLTVALDGITPGGVIPEMFASSVLANEVVPTGLPGGLR